MLTGFNTDVRFEGVVYHVQSEDRGVTNPIIDTLVYCGGQILHQHKTPYHELLAGEEALNKLASLLEAQHRDLVRRVRHGEFAPEAGRSALLPFEVGISTLDALTGALAADPEMEWLTLQWKGRAEGAGLSGTIKVLSAREGGSVEKAQVVGRLIGVGLPPMRLLEAETNAAGEVALSLVLPVAASALVVAAEVGPGGGRLRIDLTARGGTAKGHGRADGRLAQPVEVQRNEQLSRRGV